MTKLAIDGGVPVRTKEWAPWPHFEEDEIQAASDVLRSGKVNYWTGEVNKLEDGTMVRGNCGLFEHEFAEYLGTKYAITQANGSLALELCLHALDIGNGDEVIVTNRTFIASASACTMRGAVPVFADIDPVSQNITVETVKAVMTEKTKAIICVHLGGWGCDMPALSSFVKDLKDKEGRDVYLVEDCAQSLGGKYNGQMLGSIGDMAAFSFCQDKIMTTGGEGGMVTTNDPDLYKRAWAYKDHGKDFHKYNKGLGHELVDDNLAETSSYYSSVGTNWRMTEMQAAIGRKQLAKMHDWTAKRRKFSHMLNKGLSVINGIKVIEPPEHIYHAYYKYYAFLELDKLVDGWSRERVIDAIAAEGVVCQFGSTWGVGREDGWKNVECSITGTQRNLQQKEHLPNDYRVGSTALMFQVHPTLDEESIEDTIAAVKKVCSQAVR